MSDDGDSTSATRTDQVVAPPDDGAVSNSGQEFWLAFNRNYNGGGELSLFITAPVDTPGTVEVPGLGLRDHVRRRRRSGHDRRAADRGVACRHRSVDDLQRRPSAVHVVADDDVAVYGLNYIPFTTDAFLGLPVDSARHRLPRAVATRSWRRTRSPSSPRPTTPA